MGVISIRFNAREEKVLKKLTDHFNEDRSKLLKRSVMEMYEDLLDRKAISDFELKEKEGKARFVTAEQVLGQ